MTVEQLSNFSPNPNMSTGVIIHPVIEEATKTITITVPPTWKLIVRTVADPSTQRTKYGNWPPNARRDGTERGNVCDYICSSNFALQRIDSLETLPACGK